MSESIRVKLFDRFVANVPKVLGAVSAATLAVAAALYAPIVNGTSQGPEMDVRTKVILLVLIFSAASTALLLVSPNDVIRTIASLTNGFNLVWIFSFVGPPVVLAAVLGIAAAITLKRRRASFLIPVIAGLGIGVLLLRITEPPGEHIFG